MAGAMAGSAILEAQMPQDRLRVVTLTVNNTCNLECPHCYLQYSGPNGMVQPSTVEGVLNSSCETICIVGKEPLANRRSAAVVEEITRRAREKSKSVSMITNGLNAALLSEAAVRDLAWIDISLDGGPRTYRQYRRGSWEKLQRAVASLRQRGAREIRILQTVSAATAGAVDDMLEAHTSLGANLTVFSPFQNTRAAGPQSVQTISPDAFVDAVGRAWPNGHVWVAMDALYLDAFPGSEAALERAKGMFGERFIYVESDPIDRGLLRVTYDDLVLTPFDSVHTRDYASVARRLAGDNLDCVFQDLRGRTAARTLH